MKILIVDRNDVTRRLVSGILSGMGHDTIEADTGETALALLPQGIDLALVTHAHDQQRLGAHFRTIVIPKPVTPEEIARRLSEIDVARDAAREKFMRRAIDLSQEKMDQNCGGPFGAVIVRDGEIVAEGWNEVTSSNDPTAHAEVTAIRKAAARLKDYNLAGCEIYTSCEPCPMCLAAIYWARLDRIFFANTRQDAEKIGFDDDFIYREFAVSEDRRSLPATMFLRDEAQVVFDNWMKKQDKTSY